MPDNLKYRRRNYQLSDGDTYDARCGEIFITTNRNLVFHCSLCDSKYGGFDSFLEHLLKHYEKIEDECTGIDKKNYKSGIQTGNLDNGVEHDQFSDHSHLVQDTMEDELIDLEENHLNVSDFEALDEELCDYSQLQHEEKDNSIKIQSFQCEKCKKMFKNKARLKRHSLTHSEERKHTCTICGAAFKEKSNLNAHVRRHSGNKKVCCDLCSKKFYTQTEKVHHMRSHTREKPFICPHCGICFSTTGAVTQHIKQKHTEEPPIKCSYCVKSFWKKSKLQRHIVVHTKEKPFACSICDARFAGRTSCLRHAKLHENS